MHTTVQFDKFIQFRILTIYTLDSIFTSKNQIILLLLSFWNMWRTTKKIAKVLSLLLCREAPNQLPSKKPTPSPSLSLSSTSLSSVCVMQPVQTVISTDACVTTRESGLPTGTSLCLVILKSNPLLEQPRFSMMKGYLQTYNTRSGYHCY